jgi:hypothetical protein
MEEANSKNEGTHPMAYQFDQLDTLVKSEGIGDSILPRFDREIQKNCKNTLVFFRCGNSSKNWQDQNYHQLSNLNERAIELLQKCAQDELEVESLREIDVMLIEALEKTRSGPFGSCIDPYQELEPGDGLLRQIANTQSAIKSHLKRQGSKISPNIQ